MTWFLTTAALAAEPIHTEVRVGAGATRTTESAAYDAFFEGRLGFAGSAELGLRLPWVMGDGVAGPLFAGDAAIELSGTPLTGPLELSFGAEVGIPIYESGGGDTQLSSDGRSAPGDETIDVALRIAAAHRFGHGHLAASAGYRHRFGDYGDGLPWAAELGLELGPFELAGQADGMVAIPSATTQRAWARVGGRLSLVALHPFELSGWGGYTVWAEGLPQGWGAGGGIGFIR